MSRVLGALRAVVGVGGATAVLEAMPPGGAERWQRHNYADRQVSLLGGLAQAAGTTGALLGAGRPGVAAAVAAGTAGALGAVDDLTEREADRQVKGLRGHLTALRAGKVTTGTLKIAGIGAGALAAATLLPRTAPARAAVPSASSSQASSPPASRPRASSSQARSCGAVGRLLDTGSRAALIAGTANLLNLFDLRPGRALKVTCLLGTGLALAGGPGGTVAATAAGAAAAGLRDDLGERTMLGDTGANALGAALGTALAAHPSRVVRAAALSAVVGLTLASEKVSFSRVIDQTSALRAVDRWGRR